MKKLKLRRTHLNYTTLVEILELSNLRSLTNLDLRYNSLEKIGNLHKILPKLNELDVRDNRYKPCDCETVTNLSNLTSLKTATKHKNKIIGVMVYCPQKIQGYKNSYIVTM